MSTVYLQNQVNGCPDYVKVNPYSTDAATPAYYVNVADEYKYENTKVALGTNSGTAKYNMSNKAFVDFLVSQVFNVYATKDNATTPTAFDGFKDNRNGTTTSYLALPKVGSTGVRSHTAGTILSFRVDGYNNSLGANYNCALLIEETFANNDDSVMVSDSKVDIELKLTEPLMQTLTSTTGTVYDFKRSVKIADFMNNMEQIKETSTNRVQGFYQFNMLSPTNVSKTTVKDAPEVTHSAPVYNQSGYTASGNEKKYIPVTTGEPDAVSLSGNVTFTGTADYEGNTNFTGYFVMCSFGENINTLLDTNNDLASGKTSADLLKYKPYLTILRIVRSKLVQTYYTSIVPTASKVNNCILDNIRDGNSTVSESNAVDINTTDISIYAPFGQMTYLAELRPIPGEPVNGPANVQASFYVPSGRVSA